MSKTQEIKIALENAVPRKPILVDKALGKDWYKCSKCFTTVRKCYAYCPTCGQKIDWED